MTKERKKQEGVGCIGDVLNTNDSRLGDGTLQIREFEEEGEGYGGGQDHITAQETKGRGGGTPEKQDRDIRTRWSHLTLTFPSTSFRLLSGFTKIIHVSKI